MQLVDNDTFLSQLAALFESSKEKGTIWLTHKRLTYGSEVGKDGDASKDSQEYPCLLRVSDGGKVKFSTRIEASQLPKFHSAYGTLLKTSMITLRKRDKKREKQHQEQAQLRRKKASEAIVAEGPKRGNGRRKRQRKVKAALKQEESKKKFLEREEGRAKAGAN
ncbi:hypothetical protein AX16_006164 [Volvariella volvacea WC 439]|nr:hypothetical protein AX16_006164 [Volvariella volvacea WC 439]